MNVVLNRKFQLLALCVVSSLTLSSCGSGYGKVAGSAAGNPSISVQPQAVTTTKGNTASFSVTASGTATLSYQWQRSTDGGTTWADISGATSSSYATSTLAVSDSGVRYRVSVVDIGVALTSDAVRLTVNDVIAFRAVSSLGDSGTDTVAISVPTGVQQNDLMIAVIEADNWTTGNFSSTGWSPLPTAIEHDQTVDSGHTSVMYRFATSSEPASYSFVISSGHPVTGYMIAYSGVSTTNPFDVIVSQFVTTTFNASGNVSVTSPATSNSYDNGVALWVGTLDSTTTNAATPTTPTGFTQRAAGQASGWNVLAIAELALGVHGSISSYSAVWNQTGSGSGTNTGYVGAMIVLRAATGA